MNKLLVLLATLTLPLWGQIGTPQFIAADNNAFATATLPMSGSLNVAAGSAIYAYATWQIDPCGSVTMTITRTGGGTFQQIGTYHSDAERDTCSSQWVLCNASAFATDQYVATASTAVPQPSLSVMAVTGIAPSACTDSAATTAADTGVTPATTLTSAPFTTNSGTPNEILIAGIGLSGPHSAPSTTATGWTIGSGSFADRDFTAIAYKIVSAQQVGVTTNATLSTAAFIHLDTAGLIGAASPSATPASVVSSGVTGSGHD